MTSTQYKQLAKQIRVLTLEADYHAKSSHIGGSLSMVDILAVLYGGNYLNITPQTTDSPDRDRFVLSKGHCCASLYATLALRGFINPDDLRNHYGDNGTLYYTHCSSYINGVEISSGSLGHGLSVALGLALAARASKRQYNVFCLTGDGELDEGSNWEALLFAAHHKMQNLCFIVDYNKLQSMGDIKDILDIAPLAEKFKAFNWNVLEIDGHDVEQIAEAFESFKKETERPSVIIANTIKGKGVSFMENDIKWHYRNPDDKELETAKEELK